MKKIAILIQGPHSKNLNGFNTLDVVKNIHEINQKYDNKFFIAVSVWENTSEEIQNELANFTDKIIIAKLPDYAGAGNRNFQSQGTMQGLTSLENMNFEYLLKTRSDLHLNEKFLQHIIKLEEQHFNKLLVTNVFTRYENFHISDFILFSSFENVFNYFNASKYKGYEDLYSPEVQFARAFIRNKCLPYSFRLDDYFKFLRNWVELVDFNEYKFIWLKDPNVNIKNINKNSAFMFDRDCGPILTKCITENTLNFIKTTKIPLNIIANFILLLEAFLRFIFIFLKPFKYNYHHYFVDPYGPEFAKMFENSEVDLEQNMLNLLKSYDAQSKIDFLAQKYKNKKVLLYGAGKLANNLLNYYDFSKLNIVGVSDKKVQKSNEHQTFHNLNMYSIDELKNLDFDVVILTILEKKRIEKFLKTHLRKTNLKVDSVISYESLISQK